MTKGSDTISSVIDNLKDAGEYNEFVVDAEGSILINGKLYTAPEIKIIKTYRVEANSDPADEAIIYLVITCDGVMAYSLDTYGACSNHLDGKYAALIRSLSSHHSEKEIAQQVCTQLQLEKRNQSLKMVNDDLNNFVHTASHDLLAPLANIELSIRLMTRPEVTDHDLKEYSRILEVSIRKFRELIHEISAIGLVEGDMLALQSVDVAEMIEDIEWSLGLAIEKGHAVINKNIEVRYVFFSRKNLRNIIYNLLSNALKFHNGAFSLIAIEVKKADHGVTITVQDNGIGIAEEEKTHIFDLYGTVEGHGIGLYLAKKIINSIEGSISVESEVGKGSRFTLFFPDKISE